MPSISLTEFGWFSQFWAALFSLNYPSSGFRDPRWRWCRGPSGMAQGPLWPKRGSDALKAHGDEFAPPFRNTIRHLEFIN